jgi:alkanesulfonate monooxygenase SsuD/methylene tetrahydromethanopterin reductase-like flavin-dependent oxidoreductase (luciferase family)
VSPVTFRSPAVLANVAATTDHVSGGRVELGLGSGWMEREHVAFGFPFPKLRVRQEMLAEQVEIVHRLWIQDRVTFRGAHYAIDDAPGMPKPVHSPPRIVVGGAGTRGTAIAAARFAHEYNTAWHAHLREFEEIRQRVVDCCEEVGRDPATMRFSNAIHCIVGDSRDDVIARAHAVYELRPRVEDFDEWFAGLSRTRLVGTVEEIVDELNFYRSAGADRIVLMHSDHRDLDSIELIGRRLVPLVADRVSK